MGRSCPPSSAKILVRSRTRSSSSTSRIFLVVLSLLATAATCSANPCDRLTAPTTVALALLLTLATGRRAAHLQLRLHRIWARSCSSWHPRRHRRVHGNSCERRCHTNGALNAAPRLSRTARLHATCNSGYTLSGSTACSGHPRRHRRVHGDSCDTSGPTNGALRLCSTLADGRLHAHLQRGYTVSGSMFVHAGTLTAATCSANLVTRPRLPRTAAWARARALWRAGRRASPRATPGIRCLGILRAVLGH